MTVTAKEIIQVVEFTQPICSLTYGAAPCAASLGVTGTKKCFNTKRTCQNPENYTPLASIVWKFSNQKYLDCFPVLQSVSAVPTELNVSGVRDGSSPFGRRSSVTISVSDFAYNDKLSDKYVTDRGYIPIQSGTFWSKFLARNPYYQGIEIKVKQGSFGETLEERTYIIEKIEGPDSRGEVQITAYDPLRLINDKKAQFPKPVSANLIAAMDAVSTADFLIDGTLLDFQPTLGIAPTYERFLRIDKEIISYSDVTVSGDNLLISGIARGQLNTIATAHTAEKAVSRVGRFKDCPAYQALYTLMFPYVPLYMNYIEWGEEWEEYLSSFILNATIASPEAVEKLVGQICQETNIYLWWDEVAAQIRLKANRPRTATAELNDSNSVIAGSFSKNLDANSKVSRVFVRYNREDPTISETQEDNYASITGIIDSNAESSTEYNEENTVEIFSKWLTTKAQAFQVCSRILSKYRDGTTHINFKAFIKDNSVKVGDVVDFSHFAITDDEGQQTFRQYLVISSEQEKPGEVIDFKLELSEFYGRFAVYTTDSILDYDDYTSVELESLPAYGFYSDDDGKMSDGSDAYIYE